MGIVMGFRCDACDYRGRFMVGGLKATYATRQHFPVYCRGCNSIATANYRAEPLTCEGCGSADVVHMDDPEIASGDGEYLVYSCSGAAIPTLWEDLCSKRPETWTVLLLIEWLRRTLNGQAKEYSSPRSDRPKWIRHTITDGHYLCPRCHEPRLHFPQELRTMAIFD